MQSLIPEEPAPLDVKAPFREFLGIEQFELADQSLEEYVKLFQQPSEHSDDFSLKN